MIALMWKVNGVVVVEGLWVPPTNWLFASNRSNCLLEQLPKHASHTSGFSTLPFGSTTISAISWLSTWAYRVFGSARVKEGPRTRQKQYGWPSPVREW